MRPQAEAGGAAFGLVDRIDPLVRLSAVAQGGERCRIQLVAQLDVRRESGVAQPLVEVVGGRGRRQSQPRLDAPRRIFVSAVLTLEGELAFRVRIRAKGRSSEKCSLSTTHGTHPEGAREPCAERFDLGLREKPFQAEGVVLQVELARPREGRVQAAGDGVDLVRAERLVHLFQLRAARQKLDRFAEQLEVHLCAPALWAA